LFIRYIDIFIEIAITNLFLLNFNFWTIKITVLISKIIIIIRVINIKNNVLWISIFILLLSLFPNHSSCNISSHLFFFSRINSNLLLIIFVIQCQLLFFLKWLILQSTIIFFNLILQLIIVTFFLVSYLILYMFLFCI